MAACLAVYGPVRHHEFVDYDDPQYVTENRHVLAGLSWSGVRWAFTTTHAGNWHPLTWLSHMLDCQLFGVHAGAHHLVNMLFHAANSLLLFGLLHRMTGALGRSAFVAGAFAVHPLHVESVAWVAERKDVLSTMLWMITVWSYVRYVRAPRLGRYLVVFLSLALGLMAKPMLVTLPFLLLLLDYWPLDRVRRPDHPGDGTTRTRAHAWPRNLHLVWEKLPLLILAGLSGAVTFVVQHGERTVLLPWRLRVANALVSYVGYIEHSLWPARLAVLYPYQRVPMWGAIEAGLLLVGTTVLVLRAARRYPYCLVGWFWYLGTLVPVIGLVQVGNQSMADRYTYVPLIGLFILIAWRIPDLLGGWRHRRLVVSLGAALAISALALVARTQVRHWQNTTTLFGHALAMRSENYVAHFALGNVLARQARWTEATAHYQAALRLRPDYAPAYSNLGGALASQGRAPEAIAAYREALRLDPDFADAHYNLANDLLAEGEIHDAIAHYREVTRLDPDFADAHNNLGVALLRQGRIRDAIAEFEDALRLKPDFGEANRNLAAALVRR